MSAEMAPRDFERRVAALFRLAGAEVQHDALVAGSQIDVLSREKTASGGTLIRVIECKAFTDPVGVSIVRQFAGLVDLLKRNSAAHVGTIVSLNGFTPTARQAADTFGIELLELADLESRATNLTPAAISRETKQIEAEETSRPSVSKAFVVMAFDDDMTDLYLLGIREVAASLALQAERADEVLHSGSIIGMIQERIRECDVVIAETSSRNPNVMYELGYAHGVGKTVVLLSRSAEAMPFDIAGMNHIIYSSIVDLRKKLSSHLVGMGFEKSA